MKITRSVIDEAISQGIQPLSELVGRDLLTIINEAYYYLQNYNKNLAIVLQDYKNFVERNNFIGKRTERVTGKEILFVTAKGLTNKSVKTKRVIQMLELGHEIILKIRFLFSGQTIKTEAILRVDGKFYKLGEEILNDSKITTRVLSNYGASQNNPFSLAYSINFKELKNYLEKENIEALPNDVWKKMLELKPSYLETYHPDLEKPYRVFYDSKDAEIYKLLEMNSEAVGVLDVDKYALLRSKVGGRGGYASPFYKMGDIGNIQIKFFNFSKGKDIAVNYARMQLIQKQCLKLEKNLNPNQSLEKIKQGLINFYSENQSNLNEFDKEGQKLNEEFIRIIENAFKGVTK